ncbi:MAG: hypothetical protein CBC29_07305 [Methylococcaceae bacterium TMED69]|nr:MAG: hypothetical protein CBC29_05485 [Methylococcaceae bacterium TMED69]OUU74927.1 MAG: hypothetical protein CBC29_07305 [Methylococcaceae bacterium TMED69]|tara:strand:- start:824 stop:1117 length:294 start_codon:yes stop_codon:yes gene_type:complete
MAKRYSNNRLIKGGNALGTSRTIPKVRIAAENGLFKTRSYTVKEGERLDIIAGRFFGDGALWWIIAALSGIGWSMQVPPGTLLTLPVNIKDLEVYFG